MEYIVGILILINLFSIVVIIKLYKSYKDYRERNKLLEGIINGLRYADKERKIN